MRVYVHLTDGTLGFLLLRPFCHRERVVLVCCLDLFLVFRPSFLSVSSSVTSPDRVFPQVLVCIYTYLLIHTPECLREVEHCPLISSTPQATALPLLLLPEFPLPRRAGVCTPGNPLLSLSLPIFLFSSESRTFRPSPYLSCLVSFCFVLGRSVSAT